MQFDTFKNEAGLNRFTLTPKQWIESTNAIGIISKAGRYGGTYAHKDIAFEFASWVSPEFKLYIIKDYQRLPESIILESVLEGIAEYYSANLAREVMKGMKETALQCKHTGGKPPLGYDITPDKTYVINKREAAAVKLIFNMYANGLGYNQIIQELQDKNHKTQTGRHFGKNSIHGILSNEKYRGIYIYNRTGKKNAGKRNHHRNKGPDKIIRIEGGMPKLINDDVWKAVQYRMKQNKKGTNSAKEIYLLSGLIFCGKCNGAMTGTRKFAGRNKDLYVSYECSTRKRTKGCDMKAINRDYIENAVIDYLENNLFSPKAIDKLVSKIIEYSKTQFEKINKDINIFTNQLTGIDTEINNIVNAIAGGMFHPSMKAKMDDLEQRKLNLIQDIEEARLQLNMHTPTENMVKNYLKKDKDIKNKSPEEQKRIFQAYIHKIIVYEDKFDIHTIVTFDGGGEGNRTPVRNHIHKNFSGCSPYFFISLH